MKTQNGLDLTHKDAIAKLEEETGWCLCLSAKCEIWLAVSDRQHNIHPIDAFVWDMVVMPAIKRKHEETSLEGAFSVYRPQWEPGFADVPDYMPNYHTGNPKKRRRGDAPVNYPAYTKGITNHSFGPPIKRGEDAPGAKLTYQEADDIKELLRDGKLSTYEIADMYGVSKSTIVGIRRGTTWSDGITIAREPVYNPKKGSESKSAKVTEADVLVIRRRKKEGESYNKIAADYPISKASVAQICKRQTWAHVPEED